LAKYRWIDMRPGRNTYRCDVCNRDKVREGFIQAESPDGHRRLDVCADCQKDDKEPKAEAKAKDGDK
jgi:hypothetical protein